MAVYFRPVVPVRYVFDVPVKYREVSLVADMASLKIIRGRGSAKRGFSLVEILLVVLIMGVLVGVVGSLMSGFVTGFEATDDQAIARRRAQDVFNILQVPLLNAGLGLPSDDSNGIVIPPPPNNAYYFGSVSGYASAAPINTWFGPVQVIANSFTGRGDALRVVYSVYSGVKQVRSEDVETFGGTPSSPKSTTLNVTSGLLVGYDGITLAGGPARSVHSNITFPGMGMRPVCVTAAGPNTIDVAGMTPRTSTVSSEDVVDKGIIRPYHDIYFVRAGVAYVDDTSTFCLADITTTDISSGTLPRVSALTGAAYRVEGIKAVRFVPKFADVNVGGSIVHMVTGVTVFVVAEGDSSITERQGNAGTASQAFRTNYSGVIFDDEMYYEEFEMRWRTRNVEVPET
jgi:prepilin-type N-terminal cleavage/methylation domain-containing protein